MGTDELSPEKQERMKPLLKLVEKIPEETRTGMGWVSFLISHPETNGEKIPWEKFNSREWCHLLQNRPEFANHCSWEKLTGEDWPWLLRYQPQFADKCPWEKLSGAAWASLLREQPQFAEHCTWEKLSGSDWSLLVSCQPQFASRCPWKNLSDNDKYMLSLIHPDFLHLRLLEMHDSMVSKKRKKTFFIFEKHRFLFKIRGKTKILWIEAGIDKNKE